MVEKANGEKNAEVLLGLEVSIELSTVENIEVGGLAVVENRAKSGLFVVGQNRKPAGFTNLCPCATGGWAS